eukprot:Sspe_Gene.16075::Locus_5654_Transcript_3_4_Confidence_0.250_Length_1875::g.16075::m.16075/K13963/SERPINB; serpin B
MAFTAVGGHLLGGLPGNSFFSPYSVGMALGMVALAATPGSPLEKELLQLFGKDSIKDLERFLAESQQSLDEGRTDGVEFLQGNSVWSRKPVKKEFVEHFVSIFKNGKAADLTTKAPINQYVEQATNGLIKDLLTEEIDPLVIAVLVNTAYFKGMWRTPFDKEHTQEGDFMGSKGGRTVPMMNKTFKEDQVRFADGVLVKDTKATVLELPYAGNRLCGVFVLPSKPDQFEALVRAVAEKGWSEVCKALGAPPAKVEAYIPRFKMETDTVDLLPLLQKAAGLPSLPLEQMLMRMTNSLEAYISKVLHKAVVEVNEEGTTAAAATAAVAKLRCAPKPPVVFRIDRSFLFAVYDTKMKIPVFAGAVRDL